MKEQTQIKDSWIKHFIEALGCGTEFKYRSND